MVSELSASTCSMSGLLRVLEIQTQVLMRGEQTPLATKPSLPAPIPHVSLSLFTFYPWKGLGAREFIERSPLVGAGDCRRSPEVAGILRMMCADSACHHAMANHSALWVVPALLIAVWAGCPHVLPQEQGQAQQKTALVPAQYLIVLLMHMALES